MSVRSILAQGRAAHLQLLIDTCTIKRLTGQTLDPDTDVMTPTYETIYDDPDSPGAGASCRLKAFRIGRPVEAGEVSIELQRYELHLPWDAVPTVMRDDIATVISSDDSWVVGRPLTVTDISYSGSTTARHIIVEDRA